METITFVNWLASLWPVFLLICLWWVPSLAALLRLREHSMEGSARVLLALIILVVPLAGVVTYLVLSRRA